jgi:KRAB domain-containing zinc finger protein
VLDKHTERHFQPRSFECKKCEKIFKQKGSFDTHKCLKKSDRHPCTFCEKNYSCASDLTKHIKKIHADKLKIDWFYCDLCDEKFKMKGFLKTHLESLKCRSQKNFTCDHCGKEFCEKDNIRAHVKSHAVHKVECKICHAQLKPKHLKQHMNNFHNRVKVECKICHSKIKQNWIKQHIKLSHSDLKIKCKICPKIFKSFQNLKRHQKVHDKKRFSCGICDQKFCTKGSVNTHMKFHENPDQFKCKICGHQLKAKQSLKVHLTIHEKNRKKNLICN